MKTLNSIVCALVLVGCGSDCTIICNETGYNLTGDDCFEDGNEPFSSFGSYPGEQRGGAPVVHTTHWDDGPTVECTRSGEVMLSSGSARVECEIIKGEGEGETCGCNLRQQNNSVVCEME